jgi:hypothetical protein
MADFYRDKYTPAHVDPDSRNFLSYMTADPRLSPFDSHLLQIKMVLLAKHFIRPDTKGLIAFLPTRFDIGVDRYLRSTHPDESVRRRRYEFYGKEGLQAWIIRGGLVFSY